MKRTSTQDPFNETERQLQCGGIEKQPTTTNEKPLRNNWVGLLNNTSTVQSVENN